MFFGCQIRPGIELPRLSSPADQSLYVRAAYVDYENFHGISSLNPGAIELHHASAVNAGPRFGSAPNSHGGATCVPPGNGSSRAFQAIRSVTFPISLPPWFGRDRALGSDYPLHDCHPPPSAL